MKDLNKIHENYKDITREKLCKRGRWITGNFPKIQGQEVELWENL